MSTFTLVGYGREDPVDLHDAGAGRVFPFCLLNELNGHPLLNRIEPQVDRLERHR